MRLLDSLRFRIAALFRRSQLTAEMEEELRSHIQHRADDLERAGVPRAEAERRARIEFGGYVSAREQSQEAAGGALIDSFLQDVRYGARLLRKSPGFTLTAVLTLALGIGANAAVFAALDAFILRPLDIPRPESLYSIHRIENSANQSYPDYVDMRDRNRTFEDIAAYNIVMAGLDTGTETSRTWIQTVSGNYFDVLGVQPHLGRMLHAGDEHGPNSAPYIVLSYAFWHARMHDDPSVVGRTAQLNKHPYTIIGVAPQTFRGTLLFFSPDLFVPLVNQEQLEGIPFLNQRGVRSQVFMTMGHLKPGVTPEQAAADLSAISADLERTYPKDHRHVPIKLSRPSLYGEFMGGPVRAFLTALMVLAGLILVAACANLGNLFAARAADRSREVALRLALGAGRLRILRQLFTEAMLISIIGGALGLWGSVLLLRVTRTWNPFPQFPLFLPLQPDARLYAVALLLAVLSGLLFGAVPVRQVLRTDPYEIVKSGARATTRRRVTARDVLLVAQIAICAVLVTSSLVAVRGLERSLHSDFGFEPRNAMVVNTALQMAGYQGESVPPMQKRMIESLQSIPGVNGVGLVDVPPLANGSPNTYLIYADETADLRPSNATATSVGYKISPEYFRVAGTARLSGRDFSWHDDKDAPRVAIINPTFARKVFGASANALGRHFKMKDGTRYEVVGVVTQGRYQNLTEEPRPAAFFPVMQEQSGEITLIVRSNTDPQLLTAAIKSKLRSLDSGLPVFMQTWNEQLGLVLFPSRAATVALGVLGLIGAILSLTGIFGLAAYSVSQRMKELGIRMALGAQSRAVLQAALGRPFKLLVWGSAAGLVLGILASRVLASIVYMATPRDPLVLAGAVLAMSLLGLLATWIPAQRALSVDPLILLREQ
jgi:predicted permease